MLFSLVLVGLVTTVACQPPVGATSEESCLDKGGRCLPANSQSSCEATEDYGGMCGQGQACCMEKTDICTHILGGFCTSDPVLCANRADFIYGLFNCDEEQRCCEPYGPRHHGMGQGYHRRGGRRGHHQGHHQGRRGHRGHHHDHHPDHPRRGPHRRPHHRRFGSQQPDDGPAQPDTRIAQIGVENERPGHQMMGGSASGPSYQMRDGGMGSRSEERMRNRSRRPNINFDKVDPRRASAPVVTT